jgi:hypothetical protein
MKRNVGAAVTEAYEALMSEGMLIQREGLVSFAEKASD